MKKPATRRFFLIRAAQWATGAAGIAVAFAMRNRFRGLEQAPARELASERLEETSDETVTTGHWRNWSGNQRANPHEILRPANLAELQKGVAGAVTARAIGSSHSISAIAATSDTMILTDKLNRLIWLDRPRGRVKVEGGIKLSAFSDAVAAWGYALPSTGDTNYQSIAGLLSTGTHGTGMKWGSCSDEEILAGMELVLADGTLLTLDAEKESDRELMEAARIGLGSLGVIYSVTLNLVPVHNLEHYGRKGTLDDALDPRHLKENDHYEFAYFPFTRTCYMFFRNRTEKPVSTSAASNWFYREFLENDLAKVLLGVTALDPAAIPGLMRDFASTFPKMHMVDRCDRIMTIPRRNRTIMMEYALPLNRTREVQEDFQRIATDFSRRPHGERFYMNLPTQVRFMRGDRGTLLSATQGQDVCYCGVGSDVRHKGSTPMFRAMEDSMLAVGGRPHWGKLFFKNPAGLHPNLGRFMEIRKRLDPRGKFMNGYMLKLARGTELY